MKLPCRVVATAFVLGMVTQVAHAEDVQKADAPAPKALCPGTLDGFIAGKATANQIKECLGMPGHEDHNPDGRYVYVYHTKTNIAITYLFDSSGLLTRIRAYKTN